MIPNQSLSSPYSLHIFVGKSSHLLYIPLRMFFISNSFGSSSPWTSYFCPFALGNCCLGGFWLHRVLLLLLLNKTNWNWFDCDFVLDTKMSGSKFCSIAFLCRDLDLNQILLSRSPHIYFLQSVHLYIHFLFVIW